MARSLFIHHQWPARTTTCTMAFCALSGPGINTPISSFELGGGRDEGEEELRGNKDEREELKEQERGSKELREQGRGKARSSEGTGMGKEELREDGAE